MVERNDLLIPPEKDSDVFPEIVSNPPVDALKLIYSIPLYNEWENGMLLRQINAMLSQHLAPEQAIEISYVLNDGEFPSRKRDSVIDDNESSFHFLNKIILLQRIKQMHKNLRKRIDGHTVEANLSVQGQLSPQHKESLERSLDTVKQNQDIEDIIQHEADPLQRSILKKAASRFDDVTFSMVDVRASDLTRHGYTGRSISKLRTAGVDLAYERAPSADCIISLYDADTIPSSNSDVANLIQHYQDHPELQYLFPVMSYLPPGTHKNLVASSANNILERNYMYNIGRHKGSPQITFRKSAYEELGSIADIADELRFNEGSLGVNKGFEEYLGDEDFDTTIKLESLYKDGQGDMLFNLPSLFLPTSLTSDREGSFDGLGRMSHEDALYNGGKIVVQYDRVLTAGRYRLDGFIRHASGGDKLKILHNYENNKEYYMARQKVLSRFQRRAAHDFVNLYDQGEVSIIEGKLSFDKEKVLSMKNGQVLLHFISGNEQLFASFTQDDIEYVRYLLGITNSFPERLLDPSLQESFGKADAYLEPVTEPGKKYLTPFQLSLREYFGEYVEIPPLPEISKNVTHDLDKHRLYINRIRLENPRASILADLCAQYLALGATLHHAEKFQVDLNKPIVPKPDISREERSKWIHSS